jgi:hypothetical protein
VRRLRIVLAAAGLLSFGCSISATTGDEVLCSLDEDTLFVLAAQAVPSATFVPCMREFPDGWSYGGSDVRNGLATYWLGSDRGGPHAVEVVLSPTCDVTGLEAEADESGELGLRAFFERITVQPFAVNRYFVFPGGCVIHRYRFTTTLEQAARLVGEADRALTFLPRSELVDFVESEVGLTLCGAGAPPCVDGN